MEQPDPHTPLPPAAMNPGNSSTVYVHQEDTVGASFLGIITLVLLVAFLMSERRYRAALARLGRSVPLKAAERPT